MAASKTILIDVRTPAEFSTGFLSTNNTDAINIEFQIIDQLPHILSESGIELDKFDPITLYCRSGRRSNIALQTLKQLGYSNVRDIGGFEDASAVLMREDALRKLEEHEGLEKEIGVKKDDSGKKEERQKAFKNLMAGLQGLE